MFRFPWSNYHELNLDWILSVVKAAQEIFTNGRNDIDHAVSTAEEAKEIATQAAEATIPDNSISTIKLQDDAVTTPKLADFAVSNPKLGTGSVTTEKLYGLSVTTPKIGDGAVTTPKLADSSVTDIKIGSGAVTTSKLFDSAVTTPKLADNSVTESKLSNVVLSKLPAFKTEYYLVSPGEHTYTFSNTAYAFISFTDSQMSLLGLSGTTVNILGGSPLPSSANLTFNNGVLNFSNPNTWNAQLFVLYPY